MLAYSDRTVDLRAEYQDLQQQRPALVAALRTTEATADGALEALEAARVAYDRAVQACRDARRWADVAADRLRRHDAAIAEVRAELAARPAKAGPRQRERRQWNDFTTALTTTTQAKF